ncbi:helix-turn-helix domain-containing protein [Paraburkholderia sp. BR14263]|uniref:helix-turn-helix domain-containing protein n=1 Tax=unclassified Paraburkholderia TaxID=2615204 RepID=UPI0034CE8A19
MSTEQKPTSQSAGKVLDVLRVLLGHFTHGLMPGDLAKLTGHDNSSITRYINTLEEKGFAERIEETGRIRPSREFARYAVAILRDLDAASASLERLKTSLGGRP